MAQDAGPRGAVAAKSICHRRSISWKAAAFGGSITRTKDNPRKNAAPVAGPFGKPSRQPITSARFSIAVLKSNWSFLQSLLPRTGLVVSEIEASCGAR